MSEGQMIVQMFVGVPVAASVPGPSSGTSTPAEGHEADLFAGVLRGMTPEITGNVAQGGVSAQNSPAGLPRLAGAGLIVDQPGMFPTSLTALLGGAVEEKTEPDTDSPVSEEQPDRSGSEKLQGPQNVDMTSAVAQMLAAVQQVNGRMPETMSIRISEDANVSAGSTAVSNGGGQIAVPVVSGGISVSTLMPDMLQSVGLDERTAAAGRESAAAKVEEPFHHFKEAVIRQNAAASATVQQESSHVSPTTAAELKTTVEITTRIDVALQQPVQNIAQQASVTIDADRSPDPAIRQNVEISNPVQRESAIVHEAEPQAAPVVPRRTVSVNAAEQQAAIQTILAETGAKSAMEIVSAKLESGPTITTEPMSSVADSVQQPETPSVRSVIRPAMSAYFQTSVAPSERKAVDFASTGDELNPLQRVDAGTQPALAGRGAGETKRVIPQPTIEAKSLHLDVAESGDAVEPNNKTVASSDGAKRMLVSAEGEPFSFQQDGKAPSNPKPGAQEVVMPMHQPKIERSPVPASATGQTTVEAVRTNVMEQVVNQVNEHVAKRDIKNGTEQIVFRLSPENLGELKLNLRMENQCLKVEIVAENSVVRDTLIKHSDALKETLARQNITMETFDVSTGSNRQGATPQGRDGWQELTRQQQHAAWNASRGYRVVESQESPRPQFYQTSSQHSMVDVHF